LLILLTRPGADSERLEPQFSALGATCLIWPLTEIVFARALIDVPSGTQALVFTSANGVRAFAAASEQRDLAVFTVGTRTAAVARAAGFTRVESAGGTVNDLARVLTAGPRRRLFYPRGRDVSADLGDLLGDEFNLEEQSVYAADPGGPPPPAVENALRAGQIGLITLWSRRAGDILANHLSRNLGWPLRNTRLLAVSKNAAAALASCEFGGTVVAKSPDAPAMLDAVADAMRSRGK